MYSALPQALLLLLVPLMSEELVLTTIMKALRVLYERSADYRAGLRPKVDITRLNSSELRKYQQLDKEIAFKKTLAAKESRLRWFKEHVFSKKSRRLPLWHKAEIRDKPELLKQYLPRYTKDKQVKQKFYEQPTGHRRVKRMVKLRKKKVPRVIKMIRKAIRSTTDRLLLRFEITLPPSSHYDYEAKFDLGDLSMFRGLTTQGACYRDDEPEESNYPQNTDNRPEGSNYPHNNNRSDKSIGSSEENNQKSK